MKGVGITGRLVGVLDIRDRQGTGVLKWGAGDKFIDDRQREQHDRGNHADYTQHRMHQPNHREEDRRPGNVEDGIASGTAEKRSRLREITQRLRVLRTSEYRGAQTGANEFRRQPAFQPLADAGLHFVAHHFQQAEN